jgi:hypothetical protein
MIKNGKNVKTSHLPNPNESTVKLYPNEYVTNLTINRGITRLLENDKWLEDNATTGSLTGAVHTVNEQDGNVVIIGKNGTKVDLDGQTPRANIIIDTDLSEYITKDEASTMISAMIQEMVPPIVDAYIEKYATSAMWNARWLDGVYVEMPAGPVSGFSGTNIYIDPDTKQIIPLQELIFKNVGNFIPIEDYKNKNK